MGVAPLPGPGHEVVTAECDARMEDDPATPAFGLLRLDARRIELAGALGDPPPARTVWRRSSARMRPRAATISGS
jgi:hypothetical protein